MNIDSVVAYRKLYLIRAAELRIIEFYSNNQMKTPMHMSMGNEHIAVGLFMAIQQQLRVFCTYRTHSIYLSLTENTDQFFAELYGKQTSALAGRAGSMHLTSINEGLLSASAIVASGLAPAVGYAYACKLQKNSLVTATVFGDGALDEGGFWESFNLACVLKIPMLFICEDNGLAVHTSKQTRQGYNDLSRIIANFSCIYAEESSTDVEVIMALMTEIATTAYQQSKPAFIHLKCFRCLEHVGVNFDFAQGYRSEDDYLKWQAIDPVSLQRKRLLLSNISETKIKQLEQDIDNKILQSIQRAGSAPEPTQDNFAQGVFCD